jgi:hypothetical protein
MSFEDESGDVVSTPSSSVNPNKGRLIERIFSNKSIREFLIINYSINLRKNSKISIIWYHEDERRRLNNNSIGRY